MSTAVVSEARTNAKAGKPWRLGARTRKVVLVLHIASVGAWLGIDVVMARIRG